MPGDIPLKIRVAIRDQWDSPNTPFRSSVSSFTNVLGLVVTPQVEWATLYASLKDAFPDPGTFVPSICRIAIAFYSRLSFRLDTEVQTTWTENFLKTANWSLRIVASDGESLERPELLWNIAQGNFCIQIPKSRPPGDSIIEAGFDDDLDTFLGNVQLQHPAILAPLGVSPESGLAEKEDGANTGELDAEAHAEGLQDTAHKVALSSPAVVHTKRVANKILVEDLPSSDLISRPTKLFKSVAPYFLTVDATKLPLLVQGSHQPSLEYLGKYLQKWAKIDQNFTVRRPLLKVTMLESAFFSDVIDTVAIEPTYLRNGNEGPPLNPSLILAFVEGVLGYTETYTNGHRWVFKLDPDSHSEVGLVERNRKVI